jgi:hypothetical protein
MGPRRSWKGSKTPVKPGTPPPASGVRHSGGTAKSATKYAKGQGGVVSATPPFLLLRTMLAGGMTRRCVQYVGSSPEADEDCVLVCEEE